MENVGWTFVVLRHATLHLLVKQVMLLLDSPYEALEKGKEILKFRTHQKGRAKTWLASTKIFFETFKNASFSYCDYFALRYLSFFSYDS